MLQEKLGSRIAELRRERRMTQMQLAKAVGCSVEFISLVERGVNAPSVAGLERFAKVLKVEVVELFLFRSRLLHRRGANAKHASARRDTSLRALASRRK